MSSKKIAKNFISALQEAEQNGNTQALADLFSDQAELHNLSTIESYQSRNGAERFWRDYLSVFAEINTEFINVIRKKRSIILEWISRGKLANGAPINYKGVSILELEKEQIVRFRSYYDSAAFLPQAARHHHA